MDELITILDSEGNFTGKIKLKSYAHSMGLFHATVHIWFYTIDGMILIQQRGKNKDTYPLLWDVSVAGHIAAGEETELSAIREVKEEIGITVTGDSLEKIGVFKSVQKHNKNLIDCEFHHTFLCELKMPFENLQKQESEIAALHLIPLTQFSKEISGITNNHKYVPHSNIYYKTIIKAIQKRITTLE